MNTTNHTERVLELQERSWNLHADGLLEEAAAVAREALGMIEEAEGTASLDVANLLTDLAEIEHDRGDLETALSLSRQAWAIQERLSHRCTDEHEDAARLQIRTLSMLGTCYRTLGEYKEGERHCSRALAIAMREFGEHSAETAGARNDLAVLYKYSGRFDEAERLYRQALQTAQAIHGHDSLACAAVYHNLGGLFHARQAFAAAEEPARKAWEISRQELGDTPRAMLDAVAYAAVLEGLQRYDESEQLYRMALAVFERAFGTQHVEIAALLHNLAAVIEARGDAAAAEDLYRRSLAMRAALLGEEHPDFALTSNNLGRLLLDRGATSEARVLLERAVAILEQRLDPGHPHLAAAQANLARVSTTLRK